MRRNRLVIALAVAGWLLALPAVALSHGGAALQVYPPVAAPGDTVSVYASQLWTEQPVRITLLAIDGTEWVLGEAVTDGAGRLDFEGRLPDGLPAATYSIRAEAGSGDDAHVPIELISRGLPGWVPIAVGSAAVGLVIVGAVVAYLRRRRVGADP